jgi:hypothetical protein
LDVTFEYILASLIIFIMLGTSIYTVTTLTSSQLALISEQQLTPVAQQMMDKILLTTGEPVDWGYDIYVNYTNLQDFGIASSTPGTTLYDVDPAKMQRLANDSSFVINNLYIPPTISGSMLGVYDSGRYTYGFRLYIVPALNIAVTNYNTFTLQGKYDYADNFTINVKSADGVPAASAQVQARMFEFVTKKGAGNNPDSYTFGVSSVSAITNYRGDAFFSFGSVPLDVGGGYAASFLVIIEADYYGLLANSLFQYPLSSGGLNLLLSGPYLVGNLTQVDGFPSSAAHLGLDVTVIEITNNLNIVLNPATNVTGNGEADKLLNTGGKSLKIYSLANAVSPDIIIAGLLVTRNGKTYFAFAAQPNLPVSVNYYTHAFANNLQSALLLNSVTVQRYIHISRDSYVAYLTVWRMST